MLVQSGATHIAAKLVGDVGTVFGGTAYLLVGDSAQAASTSDTWLKGVYVSGSRADAQPVVSSNVITYTVTFGPLMASHAWNEWAIASGANSAADIILNRKVEYLGTKIDGQTWVVTVDFTINL